MYRSTRVWVGWIALILVLQSCSSSLTTQFKEKTQRPHQARHFFSVLDEAVNKTGVRNAAYKQIEGFPYLRTDRFFAAMKDNLKTDQQQREWVAGMRTLDLKTRRGEIQNLPKQSLENVYHGLGITVDPSKEALLTMLERFSEEMLDQDLQQENYFDVLKQAVKAPDDYSTALRVFGLYPLAYLPVAYFSDGAFDDMREWHETPYEELKQYGTIVSYVVETIDQRSPQEIRPLFSPSNKNSLGIPDLSMADRERLARTFAPIILQDDDEPFDKIGTIRWENGTPVLDSQQSTLYYYVTYARVNDETITQLNYAFWYAARDGEKAPWYEHGHLDGLTFRVSLNASGYPFMVDMMNNCGCYHFFVPEKSAVESIKPLSLEFDALVVSWLPELFPSRPTSVRVSSGWHQVQNIGTRTPTENRVVYRLAPYEELESIQGSDGQWYSAFNDEGIMKNTDRIEPYIFFSMGVPDIGAMRQRGNHPIKLIGKAHFDDPDLFETHFEFNEELN